MNLFFPPTPTPRARASTTALPQSVPTARRSILQPRQSNYSHQCYLSYTFDSVNALTALGDSDDATYSAVVTCDANGNITGIDERKMVSGQVVANEYQYYAYDDLNRLQNWRTKTYITLQSDWKWRKREHSYDVQGRLVHSTRKEWWDAGSEPSGDSLEHIYAGSRHLGNYDGSSTYGTVWNWAGAQNSHAAPLRSPNADTASQKAYNLAASSGPGGEPQRRTFQNPTTEGDKRLLFAKASR